MSYFEYHAAKFEEARRKVRLMRIAVSLIPTRENRKRLVHWQAQYEHHYHKVQQARLEGFAHE